jgi:hypothetical protein
MMDHLLNAEVMMPPMPPALRPVNWGVNKALRAATVATMPQWMRKMGGLRQPRVVDVLIRPVMWTAFRVARLSPRLQVAALRLLSPATVSVAAPVLLGVPPERPETVTPAQARSRHGVLPPIQEYARFRALVDARRGDGDPDAEVGPQRADSIALLGPVA